MDFELSSDQEALRDAARQLLERDASVERVRRLVGPGEAAAGGGAVDDFDRGLWAATVEQGWPALEEPGESGGLGLGMVEVAVLCEEIGRTVAPTPILGHAVALDALRRGAGDPAVGTSTRRTAAAWADGLADGESIGCVAFVAPSAGLSVAAGSEGAAGSESAEGTLPDGPVPLSLRPEPTVYAAQADVAVVVTDGALYALSLADLHLRPQPAMDRTRSVAWLPLDGTPALCIGGAAAARRVLDRAATATAAELLGSADRALAMSVGYASERVQFSRPIGSFQAVKHRLADALVDVEGMRSSVYFAAWCLAADHPDASLAASSAKAWCSDAARRVMASSLQVHGGIGFTWEHDLHLYVKRAQLDAVAFGDADFHRDRLVSLLAGRPDDAPALF